MTPVDATSTCCGAQPSAAAVAATVASVVARPSAPVHALAQPLLTMTACALPPEETRLARDTCTGAACTWFVVKRPAAATGASATISVTSSAPDALMPAAMPAARNPAAAVIPPLTAVML